MRSVTASRGTTYTTPDRIWDGELPFPVRDQPPTAWLLSLLEEWPHLRELAADPSRYYVPGPLQAFLEEADTQRRHEAFASACQLASEATAIAQTVLPHTPGQRDDALRTGVVFSGMTALVVPSFDELVDTMAELLAETHRDTTGGTLLRGWLNIADRILSWDRSSELAQATVDAIGEALDLPVVGGSVALNVERMKAAMTKYGSIPSGGGLEVRSPVSEDEVQALMGRLRRSTQSRVIGRALSSPAKLPEEPKPYQPDSSLGLFAWVVETVQEYGHAVTYSEAPPDVRAVTERIYKRAYTHRGVKLSGDNPTGAQQVEAIATALGTHVEKYMSAGEAALHQAVIRPRFESNPHCEVVYDQRWEPLGSQRPDFRVSFCDDPTYGDLTSLWEVNGMQHYGPAHPNWAPPEQQRRNDRRKFAALLAEVKAGRDLVAVIVDSDVTDLARDGRYDLSQLYGIFEKMVTDGLWLAHVRIRGTRTVPALPKGTGSARRLPRPYSDGLVEVRVYAKP